MLKSIKLLGCFLLLVSLPVFLPFKTSAQEKNLESKSSNINRIYGKNSTEEIINFNTYYRFPVSIGVEYHNITPFSDYAGQYNTYDISLMAKYPIRKNPKIQPFLKAGVITFDYQHQEYPDKWDHRDYYLGIGISYINRFSKNFEVGGRVSICGSEAIFKSLIPEEGTLGNTNLLLEAGFVIGLDPSYNLNININPTLKYQYSLGNLKDFNGLMLSIGFGVDYRFGQDPDTSAGIIRDMEFVEIEIPHVFAAMQSYYVKNPAGFIKIKNISKHSVTNVEIFFNQEGYMDSPTPTAKIEKIEPGEIKEVPIFASFNNNIFKIEGVTPLTGEIIVKYLSRGRPAEQKAPFTYDLYDKTSIVWNDDRKAAAFITPADSALRNYTSFIRQTCKDIVISAYNENIQVAMQIYSGLTEIGCLYQSDPTSPFSNVHGDPISIDSVSLPRETLKRITGDCDDLTVLFCSLLETVGVETGFITVPGHIFPVFNTNVSSAKFKYIYPDRSMIINVDGEIWVPVEITLVGKTGFLEAWKRGISEWNQYVDAPGKRGFYKTRDAQKIYRPVGLIETDLGLQYGDKNNIRRIFKNGLNTITNLIIENQKREAEKKNTKVAYNRLGITLARYRRYNEAEIYFKKAIELDSTYAGAIANLGCVYMLKKDYTTAVLMFEKSLAILKSAGKENSLTALKILINMSKAHYLMENYSEASKYYNLASKINPEKTKKYCYLIEKTGVDKTRALEQRTNEEAIFIKEGED